MYISLEAPATTTKVLLGSSGLTFKCERCATCCVSQNTIKQSPYSYPIDINSCDLHILYTCIYTYLRKKRILILKYT